MNLSPHLFRSRPLVPLAFAFGAGIISASTIHSMEIASTAIASMAIVLLFVAAASVLRLRRAAGPRTIAGAVLIAGFAAAGALRQFEAAGIPPGDVSRFAGGEIVRVAEQATRRVVNHVAATVLAPRRWSTAGC